MKLKEKPFYLLGGNAKGIPFDVYSKDHEFDNGSGLRLYASIDLENQDSDRDYRLLESTDNMHIPFDNPKYNDRIENANCILAAKTESLKEADKIKGVIAKYNKKNKVGIII